MMIPPTVMLYGPTKIGKSTAWINALGGGAFCIATEIHAIAPAFDRVLNPSGRIPGVALCLSATDPCVQVNAAIDRAAPDVKAGRYAAVVVDTFSTLADREWVWIQETVKGWDRYNRGRDVLYGRIQGIVGRIVELGAIAIGVAHERGPQTIEGRFSPGGPKLPGRLVDSTPSLFGTVLRCMMASNGSRQAVFGCDRLDRNWVTGDSWNVVRDGEPMNLASVLLRIVEKAAAGASSSSVIERQSAGTTPVR